MDNEEYDEAIAAFEELGGVKANLIADLKTEFEDHDISVTIDDSDGYKILIYISTMITMGQMDIEGCRSILNGPDIH